MGTVLIAIQFFCAQLVSIEISISPLVLPLLTAVPCSVYLCFLKSAPHPSSRLYVGSLHFNLTESDIKQVFEPFGDLEFVDLHKDPMTGRSKGYAFVQYKRGEDAKMALEQMEGFELAGRTVSVLIPLLTSCSP
jgi:hypothetical protein